MSQPTEQYLSREVRDKPISKNTIQNLKCAISKAIGKKKGLFRKKAVKEDSLDSEIRAAIEDIKKPQQDIINQLFQKEIIEDSDFAVQKYEAKANKMFDEIKNAFKNLYSTFVGYAKGTYTSIKTRTRKIIEGPVRMTTEKFCKVGQYIMAAVSPQWNMPTLSKMDFDTLSVQIANHITIGEEGIKHNPAYGTLRYAVKD
jgi:hypothetical protein